ncbi:MAG: MFS transporter, partial [Actinomycetota bacterium]|nr:MFS transporter [Actinomycetota bacterium]
MPTAEAATARTTTRRTSGPTDGPTTGLTTWQLVLLGSVTALGPLSTDLYLPAFPELARDLGASEAAVQLTLTACVVGLALGQPVAGPLSDRFGRRTPILAGLLAWSAASVACALAPSIATLTVLRFAQ